MTKSENKLSNLISESERLKHFWNARYNQFSLQESGIKGLGKKYVHYLYQCKLEAYLKALKQCNIKTDDFVKILDAGCGQGFFAEQSTRIFPNYDYTGVDISDKVISHLKTKYQAYKWVLSNFCDPNFYIGEKFDIIQSIEVLHLIVNDTNHFNAMKNLSKCLSAHGTLIITDVLPVKRKAVSDYMVFRPLSYYEKICSELNLKISKIFPMYYWLPDRGSRIPPIKYLFYLFPSYFIYSLDRLFLNLKLPQIFPSHDAAMKMLIIKKRTDHEH